MENKNSALLNKFCRTIIMAIAIIFAGGCSLNMSFDEMPISYVDNEYLKREVSENHIHLHEIYGVMQNDYLLPRQKIELLAKLCTIRDIVKIFWYLDMTEHLCEKPLELHSARQIFDAQKSDKREVSFECMEAAMLATEILREKKIEGFIVMTHRLDFSHGHAVCVYRTELGWASVGINWSDFIEPTEPLALFKRKLDYQKDKVLYSIVTKEDIHPSFVDGDKKEIFWSNTINFFKSCWY